MTTPHSAKITETSFTHDMLHAARYYILGRRGLLILGGLVLIAGLALNWSWLVAAGIAPILLGVLPCLAMCALGLCMKGLVGRSCSTGAAEQESSPAMTEGTESVMRNSTIDDLRGNPTDKLSGQIGVGKTINPKTKSLVKKE